jgi:HTH-type transcriptional regulator / antitoxin HigA
MATERLPTWSPEWRVAPGEILGEALQERGLTQSDLARRMGRPLKTINEIVNGKASITPETAIQLERTLGISASFWNNLETRYREHLAREQAQRELEGQTDWLRNFPTAHLARLGLIRGRVSRAEALSDLLGFFGVSSPQAWERHWSQASAARRASRAFVSSPHSTSVWLRWGELAAAATTAGPFDEKRFLMIIEAVRGLSRVQPFMSAVDRLKSRFAEAGVIVLLVPEVQGTRLSGAAWWLTSDRAVIQLSLRHKSDDQFWFTVFHECGHLVSSSRRRDFVDAPTDVGSASATGEELQADLFARETLMPSSRYEPFINRADFGPEAVRSFARELDISPGIVVGRLQRDGHVGRGSLNFLKQPYTWPTEFGLRSSR